MNLFELQNRNQNGTRELRALAKQLGTLRARIASAGREADGDPAATAALVAARVQQLRELESAALKKIAAHRQVERETRGALAGGLGVNLTPSERAEAAHFAQLYPDGATAMPLAEVRAQLQAAILHDDRPAMFFWGNVARTRLSSGGVSFGDTRELGRDPGAVAARSALFRLLPEVEERLRDRSAEPVLEAADRLRAIAGDLMYEIERARANRGEGPTFSGSFRTVPVPGRETYDPSGYVAVDEAS